MIYLFVSELLQPDQPEGQGGRALADPVPVRWTPPHCQPFLPTAVNCANLFLFDLKLGSGGSLSRGKQRRRDLKHQSKSLLRPTYQLTVFQCGYIYHHPAFSSETSLE